MNKETTKGPNSEPIVAPAAENELRIANGYDECVLFNGRGLGKAGHEDGDTFCMRMSMSNDVLTTDQTENSKVSPGGHLESPEVHLDDSSGGESSSTYVSRNGNMSESVSSVDSRCASISGGEFSSEHSASQTLSFDEGEGHNVDEVAMSFQSRNPSSYSDRTLPSAKILDRISDPLADVKNNSGCQAVVASCSAATRATSASDVFDNGCVVDVHSSSSSLNANTSGRRDDITALVTKVDVPTFATSTLAKDVHGVFTSTSTSANIPFKVSCEDLGISSCAVANPLVCMHSSCLVVSMHSSSSSSSANATSDSTSKLNERHIGESLHRVMTKCDAVPTNKTDSTKVEDVTTRTRNPGNVKQRYSDVPVKSETLCPDGLDHESRSCMELSKDSESLKNLTADQTKVSEASGNKISIPSAVQRSEVIGSEPKTIRNDERNHAEDPLLKKRYDRRSVTSISSDSRLETRCEPSSISPGCIVASQSTEKIVGRPNACVQFYTGGGIVRSSRSQENYFDSGDITCVDIDLDDNIASSVDALHYDTSSMASLDSMSVHDWQIDGSESDLYLQLEEIEMNRSKQNSSVSAEQRFASSALDNATSTKFSTSVSVLKAKTSSVLSRPDEPRSSAAHGIALSISGAEIENAFSYLGNGSSNIPNLSNNELKQSVVAPNTVTATSTTTVMTQSAIITKDSALELRPKIDETDATASVKVSSGCDENDEGLEDIEQNEDLDFMFRDESFFRQQTKDVDRPSAARLAKRLFYLHGFKKSDVSRHLSKKNSFSQLVGEEYLKYFDFSNEQLDGALRRFMKHMIMYGENQDRDRLLAHFSSRYQQCNPNVFKSEDCCHTLSCALLLLNNDLNGQNIGRKITLMEFISNMADMNDGEQFPKELLKSFYTSIKNQPLEFEAEDAHEFIGSSASGSSASAQTTVQTQGRLISYNPFYDIPDPSNAVEFKKGYVMRKCCLEPDGRKTPLGKRGWKMFYATLRDMVLHLHIDEHGFKRNQQYTSTTNAVHIYHSLATKATDYQKKNHVFRLQTADLAQYLIQTSDSKECQEWIDAINFVAASYSAPSSISSVTSQKRFQRPLLPSTYTRLNLREQINHHERMIADFDRELVDHRKNPPEKGAKTRLIQDYCKKENYLKFELKRYKTYCRLLQYKVSTFPELEPSLAEIAIGEVDEPSNSPPVEPPFEGRCPKFLPSLMDFSPQSDRLQS